MAAGRESSGVAVRVVVMAIGGFQSWVCGGEQRRKDQVVATVRGLQLWIGSRCTVYGPQLQNPTCKGALPPRFR